MDRFRIGHVTVHRIEEWQGTFAPPSYLFQGYTPDGWDPHAEEFAPEYYDPATGQLYAFLQSWVLDTGKERILFDTGVSTGFLTPPLGVTPNTGMGPAGAECNGSSPPGCAVSGTSVRVSFPQVRLPIAALGYTVGAGNGPQNGNPLSPLAVSVLWALYGAVPSC